MKRKKYLVLLLIIVISCKPSTRNSEEEEIVKGQLGDKINNYLLNLEPFGLSGSFLVAKQDTIIFHKAYGSANKNEKIKNTINTLFSTGSITKQFTATAILKLEEAGLLNTSDLISKYIENVPIDKSTITLHHLLNHTSGLPAIVSKDDFDAITREEFIHKLITSELLFEPGSEFAYSNSAYGFLAVIIENLTGKQYDEYLSEELFKSIGILNIGYTAPTWKTMYEAHNYVDYKDYGPFQERNYPNWNLIGNGGLLTTTTDLFNWMMAIKKNKIISEQSKTKLLTPGSEDFAYGWEVFDDSGKVVEHTSAGDGNNSIVYWLVDQDIMFIGLSNYSFDGKDIIEYLYEDMFRLTHDKKVQSAPIIVNRSTEAIGTLLFGTYKLDSTSHLKIQPFENGLKIQAIGQEARNLFDLKESYVRGIHNSKNKIAFEAFQRAIENDDYSGFDKLIQDEERIIRTRKLISSFTEDSGLNRPWVIPYISEENEDGLQS